MPSAVGYAPRNPSGHLSGLLAGIHADPLLLLLERLHHEPEKRSAPISERRTTTTSEERPGLAAAALGNEPRQTAWLVGLEGQGTPVCVASGDGANIGDTRGG